MAHFDAIRLQRLLAPACRISFAEVRARHRGERFYCMGLFTCGLFGYLVPTAMTEEGLDRVVREYQANPRYASEPVSGLRFSLRWSPSDSPLHLEGEEHFEDVNCVMQEITDTLNAINIDNGWDEFEDFVDRIQSAICDVLKEVDEEGVFGIGQERERTFVTMLMGDQDDSILHLGRRLNPPKTIARFEREWQDWHDYWSAKSRE